MEKRLQRINGDTVLEVTAPGEVKTRLSRNDLLRRKAYFEDAIARFTGGLADVNEKLALIDNEQARQAK